MMQGSRNGGLSDDITVRLFEWEPYPPASPATRQSKNCSPSDPDNRSRWYPLTGA